MYVLNSLKLLHCSETLTYKQKLERFNLTIKKVNTHIWIILYEVVYFSLSNIIYIYIYIKEYNQHDKNFLEHLTA